MNFGSELVHMHTIHIYLGIDFHYSVEERLSKYFYVSPVLKSPSLGKYELLV